MKILKIKYHSRRLLPVFRRSGVKFSFITDLDLKEILELVKVDKKGNVVCGGADVILDDNHIFFEISDTDENIINDKVSKLDKVKKAKDRKEFEIINREVEKEL